MSRNAKLAILLVLLVVLVFVLGRMLFVPQMSMEQVQMTMTANWPN